MIVPFVTLHVSAISALTAVTTALTLHVAPGVEIHLYEVLAWAEAPHRWRIYQLVLQTMVTFPLHLCQDICNLYEGSDPSGKVGLTRTCYSR